MQLGQHVVFRMSGVQHHERPAFLPREVAHAGDDAGIRGIPVDQRDPGRQLVCLDGAPIVRTELDLDPDDAAAPEEAHQARVEDERAPVGDTGLDHQIGLHLVDRLLHADQVLRELDHRPPEPREPVDVLRAPPAAEPRAGHDGEGLRRRERMGALPAGLLHHDERVLQVDRDHGGPSLRARCRR